MLDRDTVAAWLYKLADVYEADKDHLTELDSAIGDADHGINMARGFGAVRAELEKSPPDSMAAALKTTSTALIKNVGGAAGPLYGTLFMKMLPSFAGKDAVGVAELAKAAADGVEGIKKMGKGTTGEKTMLDAWAPAAEALAKAAADGADLKTALAQTVEAAREGMKATIPMLATKGRASYLGERSIGHQDPGATSSWLMIKALAEVL